MKQQQSITTLSESPDDERRRRMVQYAIAMTLRLVCIVLCLFVQGWWLVLPILGAVVLPYIGVVLANVATRPDYAPVERPGALVHVPRSGPEGSTE